MRLFANRGLAFVLFGLLVPALVLVTSPPHWAQRARPAATAAAATPTPLAQPLQLPGIDNFAEVTSTLFRGAQPTLEGFQELKKLGVEIDVNLRDGGRQSIDEQRAATALGMRYVDIAWSSLRPPRDDQVAEFLELLRANPDRKIFVHCREGRDRTGVMVAAFRIVDQHWSAQQAVEEMHAFHFHSFWLHSWKNYVEHFPDRFAADPAFRPLQPATPGSTR